ncbi:hypothetical protein [Vibrio sp.]|uniref:hypothetical protein n=1 Tax=Vibrio sp. TaxID=678 RepID=UPI003D0A7A03
MLTKDVTDELHAVMEQLEQQGKQPTVALVKARLTTPIPMPALVTAIKSWKSAHRVPKVEVAAQPAEPETIAQLQQQVNELTERVNQLEIKLSEKLADQ